METSKYFSVLSIKERISSLPETFYGETCNVSFSTADILRNMSHNGEPMLFKDMGLSLCLSGEAESETNLNTNRITPGTLELFTPGTIYQLNSISDECQIIGLAFTPFVVKEIFEGNTPWELLEHRKDIRIMMSDEDSALFRQMSSIYLELLQSGGEQSISAQKMGSCILSFAKERFERMSSSQEAGMPRGSILCRNFVALLGEAKGRHRNIGWFADKLCVSRHYLCVAVKKSGGRTAKELIDRSVIAEIKVRLIYGRQSVAQIASELEFGNSSLLCKYFKSLTGLTPLQYRNNTHNRSGSLEISADKLFAAVPIHYSL